jgi:nucleoid-associated protein
MAGPNVADVKLRPVALDVSKPLVITLADKLASLVSLNSGSLQYGQFSDDRHEGRFPGAVEQLLAKSTNKSFFSMTSVAMDELKRNVNGVNFATGGYVCFLVYTSGGDDFLLVAMIKEREALQLTEDFEPKEIIEIDLSKLHQAARINLNRYRAAIAKGGARRERRQFALSPGGCSGIDAMPSCAHCSTDGAFDIEARY